MIDIAIIFTSHNPEEHETRMYVTVVGYGSTPDPRFLLDEDQKHMVDTYLICMCSIPYLTSMQWHYHDLQFGLDICLAMC